MRDAVLRNANNDAPKVVCSNEAKELPFPNKEFIFGSDVVEESNAVVKEVLTGKTNCT